MIRDLNRPRLHELTKEMAGMYLIYLFDGTIIATSTSEMAEYIEDREAGNVQAVTFCESVDVALEKANRVEQ